MKIHLKFSDVAKAVLREKFIAINVNTRKHPKINK